MTKILVVDDSAYARRIHRTALERMEYTVTEAGTGTAAIEAFMLDRPDVVLLDLSMEDIQGVDVLRTMRQVDETARVIVVSADCQRSTEEAVLAAGAAQLVAKPASPERLLGAIHDVLGTIRT